MGMEVNVLQPFFAFVVIFNLTQTHNMCALQMDPWFRGLQCVMGYVGKYVIKTIVKECD
jgi:hypothetical protein